MGGRLDAVNIIDADVAIVTSVDLDHQDYLGDTREAIGFEKAGIYRAGRAAICSDPAPPASLIDHATNIGADLWLFGRDFNYSGDRQQWNYGGRSLRRNSLAYPSLRGANQLLNASAALAALEALRDVATALEAKFGEPRKSKLIWKAQNLIAVDDEAGEKIMKLLDNLEENDDVQNVYSNAEFSDALMTKLGG